MKKLLCFDMDGTIYLGNNFIEGAYDALSNLYKDGYKIVYITNNSSINVLAYVEKMKKFGFNVDSNDFYTSVEATIHYLKVNNIDNLFVLGTPSLKEELAKHFNLVYDYVEGKTSTVLVGFDTSLTYDNLVIACKYLEDGATFLATNMDKRCPKENNRYIPDCAAICQMLTYATNRTPLYIGKPNKFMMDSCLEKYNVKKEDALIIGDRLYTDIASGVNSSIDSVLVLSGESTLDDVKCSDILPTYIIKDITELKNIL